MHFPSAVSISMAVCIATSLVQTILLVVLVRKGLRRTFPFFFAYTAACAAGNVIVTAAYGVTSATSMTYFYIYWVTNTITMLLEFGIMYEIFVHAVKPYAGLIDLAKMLFGWAGLFLLLAAGLTAFSTGGSHLTKCVVAIAYLDRGLGLMQCGLVILFFLFERRLGLSWRSPSVCVALGLGSMAATELSATFIHTHFAAWAVVYDLASNVLSLGIATAWVLCFRLPQPARKTVLDSPSKLIFQRWNEALLASPFSGTPGMAMASADPFLPGVEKTVDRILARKMVS